MAKSKVPAPTSFEFEENGITYTCTREGPDKFMADAWWWFSVSSAADRQRYAPFRAEPGDTPASVRPRIVAWYAALLEKRATPTTHSWGQGRPPANAAAKAEKAAEPEVEEVEE
ncbi:MAG: hypothetical protein JNJ98_07225 [Gemmatimonadetes bacterium]|nr:hypothetical protein [Gemmatimonadota bacterium]